MIRICWHRIVRSPDRFLWFDRVFVSQFRLWVFRVALAALLSGVTAAGAWAAVLNAPGLVFPHTASEGRITIWSDREFARDDAIRILADVQVRLAGSPLDDGGHHGVVIAQESWRQRLVFLWAYGAGGVNHYPLTRNVFIRNSNVALGQVFGPSGQPAAPPRTLSYFIAHEIAHTLTIERVGPLAYWRMPIWIREGVADHVGLAGRIDIDEHARRLRDGDPVMNPARSGHYARYRLLVAALLERKGWTLDRLLQSRMTLAEAEALVLSGD